jgi:hypothetical protein
LGRGRRLDQRDSDQPLHDIGRAANVDPQSDQQRNRQRSLNDHDRGERHCALPRPGY